MVIISFKMTAKFRPDFLASSGSVFRLQVNVLVDQQIDPEVISFLAQFDQKVHWTKSFVRGARRMLQSASNAEVGDFIAHHAHRTDQQGWRLVVKNGSPR